TTHSNLNKTPETPTSSFLTDTPSARFLNFTQVSVRLAVELKQLYIQLSDTFHYILKGCQGQSMPSQLSG
ncbi:MAG: hypothetical protein V2I33_25415, partial [Kangiellaceae bacterium]|nr:hypothetical protein [Kangiellaceae bacterium]